MTPVLRQSTGLGAERGSALVIALGVCIALAILATGVIDYSTSSSRSAAMSGGRVTALALAEAGINAAESMLNYSANNAAEPTLLQAQRSISLPGGTATWSGTFNALTATWTVTSTGTLTTPASSAPISRTVVAQIQVLLDYMQPLNVTAWNWILATKTSNSTTCDSTIGEGSDIDTPLFVYGNLCLDKNAQVIEGSNYNPPRPVNLTVKGKLAFIGDYSGSVGASPSQPITEADLVGGCSLGIATTAHPCNPSSPTNDKVWVRTLRTTAAEITAPVADFATYYENASPGPRHPCTVSSGTPPVFDNDGTLDLVGHPNGSVPPFELTPTGSDYVCQTKDANGTLIGEISWNHSTDSLSIHGDVYIDGGVTVSLVSNNSYSGFGVLYLSGTFWMIKNSHLCAMSSGTSCNFNQWNPNTSMLGIIAHGNDGTGNSIYLQEGNALQATLYATNTIYLGKNATVEGPMVAGSINLQKPVVTYPFPLITTVPVGLPGNPNARAIPAQPLYVGGG